MRNTTSSAIIRCLENHFTHHDIPETIRKENGPNLASHEMEKFLDKLGIEHKKTIPLWPRANGEVNSKINCYSRQCVWHKHYRNIFLHTGQHLTPRLVSALPSCCMDRKSKPRCQSSKATKRRRGQVPLISRPEIRMQRRKSEGLKLQIGELQSQR